MALLFFGKTICPLCEQVIVQGDSTISFPAFITNEADPCFVFSDRAFHTKCVRNNDLGEIAVQRFSEWQSKIGPGKRKCTVCQLEVTQPDNYLVIEELSNDVSSPLHIFNYTHLHKTCIPKWELRDNFIEAAKNVIESKQWKGGYLSHLIHEIESL